MRLGQLARKLALRPSQIVDFLSTQQIYLEEGSNARIEDDRVVEIVNHFSPARLQEIVTNLKAESTESEGVVMPPVVVVEEVNKQEVVAQDPVMSNLSNAEPPVEKPEVIKAPKVELSGLKVLGKIELPEPKKKEVVQQQPEAGLTPAPEEKRKTRTVKREVPKSTRESTAQQTWRNPIAQQRQREASEAEERKKAATEREKERRRENYLKKVKLGQPTKAMKLMDEPTEQLSERQLEETPTSWWGRFKKWLNN
jgi:hypothetical protein